MDDLVTRLGALFSEEEIAAEQKKIADYGFRPEPENDGVSLDVLYAALSSLAENYQPLSRAE